MMWLLLACTGSTTIPVDTAVPDDTGAPDSGDSGEEPRDLDADGYPAGEDCMDLNNDVHPGATEVWNGLDDDCDGVTDAEGTWTGTAAVDATAIYEGHPYSYSLSCPLTGTLLASSFSWTITCTPDASNAREILLLGESFTLTPEDPAVDGQSWSGTAILASSAGWDTDTDASITWANLDHAGLVSTLDAVSLGMSTTATLIRD